MAEDIATNDDGEGLKLTAYYSRKRGLPDYSSEEASVFVSQSMPGVMAPDELASHLQSLFVYAKSEVYQQLALPFAQDEATGRIMESFPDTKVVAMRPKVVQGPEEDDSDPGEPEPQPARRARAAHPSGRSTNARGQGSQRSTGARGGSRGKPAPEVTDDDLWELLEQDPSQFYDNRATKPNPRGPDFTSKTHKQPGTNYKRGLWLNAAPDWYTGPGSEDEDEYDEDDAS